MNILDYVQTGVVCLTAVSALAGALNRWAVANRRDRLASLTSAAGNAAGRLREAGMSVVASGANPLDQQRAILAEAEKLFIEFDTTGPKVGATPEKLAKMIAGQLGQIPT